MNILVTGANSELAQSTIELLSKQGYTNLYGLVNRNTNNLRNPISYLSFDDLRNSDVEMNAVIHIAAHIPWSDFNSEQTKLYECNCKLVAELCNMYRNARAVLVSSISVYGDEKTISESSLPAPKNAYALSKMCAELIVGQLKSYAILRLGAFYGENVKSGFVNRILEQASSGEITLFGNGERKQYYIDIDSVAHILIKSLEYKNNFSYPLAGLTAHSNKAIADLLIQKNPAIGLKFNGSDSTASTAIDASKIYEILDFDYIDKLEQYVKAKLRANG